MENLKEIIVLCGKAGAGKDTIATGLKNKGYNFIVSHTTRPMREGESQGNPYYFVSDEEFKQMFNNEEFLEARCYKTKLNNKEAEWFYGVHKTAIDDDKKYVVVLDIEGLKDFKKMFTDRVISFFISVSDSIRTERAKKRGSFDLTEWNRRLKADNRDFSKEKILENVMFCGKCDNLTVEEIIKAVEERVEFYKLMYKHKN